MPDPLPRPPSPDVPPLVLRLAGAADAPRIAGLSRELIEHGLEWSWTPARVRRAIADPQTNVVVTDRVTGFGIMKYHDTEAHLLLLAVDPAHARAGTGSALLGWLERSARVAGIARIGLEARVGNEAARAFYRHLGYHDIAVLPGYYQGVEASVRMVKDLVEARTA